MISNNDDPDRDADQGIFELNFYPHGIDAVVQILLISEKVVDEFFGIFLTLRCLTRSNKLFNSGADPDHDQDLGIF